ncbi:N-acetyltransferase 10, partial [Saguinus oedipus]
QITNFQRKHSLAQRDSVEVYGVFPGIQGDKISVLLMGDLEPDHRKKRMRQLQKKIKNGTLNVKQDDPFELFIAATNIRYCYYNETHKILGNTFGMCVLQTFLSSEQWDLFSSCVQTIAEYLSIIPTVKAPPPLSSPLSLNTLTLPLRDYLVDFCTSVYSLPWQDFEALTPNLLARTVETVEGGGLVVILLRTMNSLKQLYTMTMDVHSRYRTEAHQDVAGRFNERFILSLASCKKCLVIDDQLNILPISSHIATIEALPPQTPDESLGPSDLELKELKESLQDTQPVGVLVDCCKTLDQVSVVRRTSNIKIQYSIWSATEAKQAGFPFHSGNRISSYIALYAAQAAKAVLKFIEGISEKTLRSTVALTAARGRGKSAALGLAIAGAVAFGYSNIFVTSPSPDNLHTLFEFVFKGFDALQYQEHLDYEIIQSLNPEFNKAVIRVNVFREHRQTIQGLSGMESMLIN